MIYKEGTRTPTTGIYSIYNGVLRVITAVYKGTTQGARLIWQMIRSCYGTGIWMPERPWLDNDMWKNNR